MFFIYWNGKNLKLFLIHPGERVIQIGEWVKWKYYENPKRYKALAILSGHPNLARSWGYFDGINFLEEINLVKFKNVPIYIFHGENDINCPFELTKELFNKLKKNGCNVVFEIEESGHGNMNLNSRNNYYHWLKEQIK